MPIVKLPVAHSVLANFRGVEMCDGLEDLRERVRRDNPNFVTLVEAFTSRCPDPSVRKFSEWTALVGYAIVESQADADALAEQLKGRI